MFEIKNRDDAIEYHKKYGIVRKDVPIAGCQNVPKEERKPCVECEHLIQKVTTLEFPSTQHLLSFVNPESWHSKSRTKASSRAKGNEGWYGTPDYEKAIELAKKGWYTDLSEFDKLRKVIFEKVTSEIIYDKFFLGTEGFDFDIPSVIQELPEQWWDATNRLSQQRKRIITINANVSASCGIDASYLTVKGAALMAMAEALQTAGLSCEIRLVEAGATDTSCPSALIESSLILKHADAPYDKMRLMFFLAHPAALRRIFFSIIESAPDEEWDWLEYGYGYPYHSTYKADIVFPYSQIRSYNKCQNLPEPNFESVETATSWIIESLKKQGLRFHS